ncbi:4-hydroxybenzoate octaprenyltransferase [Algicella marina]|uniref:4-hydroxybenzoate octaprenyltransferase n=1 Tax=Algicella marina TaxID=2683284 RepID=A0A6P1SZ18_9RHOB|nr:4-hydroxybenzoate octaprenyltransferase [Algicella marina]QHQ35934.1 4-hydroxybenzoate octaprenyltransferase [Algicella marina]
MTETDHNHGLSPDTSVQSGGRVADATDANWVDRFAPPATRPYLRLSRADRPAGTWLLLLPCWWGLGLAVASMPQLAGPQTLWIATGCAIGAFLMRGAGCTWNDIADRKIDASVARTKSRPIPSGQVSVNGALVWMVIQSLLAFGILLTFHPMAIALGIGSLLLVAIYPFAKRFTWWPQVFLGLAFNWGALLAWAAYSGTVGKPAILLYAAGIGWTLFYDTIYAHQDKEDDALIGVKSTARLFGETTGRWLFGFLVASVCLMGMAAVLALISAPPVALLAGLGGAWGFGWHLARQMRMLRLDEPDVCLQLFRSNREAGLIPVLAFCLAAASAILLSA